MIMRKPAKLAFYKGKGTFFDKIIRFWTRSKYSHVELVFNGEWYSSSPRDLKIRKTIMDVKPENWDFVDIGILPSDLIPFFKETNGAKYDWVGIFFSQIFPLNRDSKEKWFCSEWCAEASGLVTRGEGNKYSPEKLYKLVLEKQKV